MKLYHVDYPGVNCQHIVASSRADVISIMLAWLTHNNHPRTAGLKIAEVDPMNLDRKGRQELAKLLEANIDGMASYDPETGWSLHTVFEAPYP